MSDYAIVSQYTAMKGVFTKTIAGEFLILGIKDSRNNTIILFQFFKLIKDDLYLIGIVGGTKNPNNNALEQVIDSLRLNTSIKILEDNLPIKINFGSSMKITFEKQSKYLGKNIEISNDSRLPEGYMICRCTMKEGFEPSKIFSKFGTDTIDLSDAKKIRAFTTSRLKSIMNKI